MKNGRRKGCNDGGDPESKPGESRVHANAKAPNLKKNNFVIGLIILMLNCKLQTRQIFLKSVDCMSAPWPLVSWTKLSHLAWMLPRGVFRYLLLSDRT